MLCSSVVQHFVFAVAPLFLVGLCVWCLVRWGGCGHVLSSVHMCAINGDIGVSSCGMSDGCSRSYGTLVNSCIASTRGHVLGWSNIFLNVPNILYIVTVVWLQPTCTTHSHCPALAMHVAICRYLYVYIYTHVSFLLHSLINLAMSVSSLLKQLLFSVMEGRPPSN